MASRGVNSVTLIGNLTRDPEVRQIQSGAVCNFSVATSESWKDKQTGEQKEQVEYHNITMFGRLAEISGEYLRKGAKVYLQGKLQTRSYEKDGIKRYATDILARDMQMLDSRQSAHDPVREKVGLPPQAREDDFDDDIPF